MLDVDRKQENMLWGCSRLVPFISKKIHDCVCVQGVTEVSVPWSHWVGSSGKLALRVMSQSMVA